MRLDTKLLAASAAILLALAGGVYFGTHSAGAAADSAKDGDHPPAKSTDSLDLTNAQLAAVKIEPIGVFVFPLQRQAMGSIDFNEDRTVQIFTPYQGRIIDAFVKLGDEVRQGETLFTIESPDLIQAESTVITAAGVLDLTSRALVRAKQLYAKQGMAQKDLEQAISDQQSAEGALRAARDAVRVFGKTDAEIDRIVAQRRVDRTLVVPSPISGRVTARNAQPGLLVQPGNAPAPYTVADLSTMWMVANVTETDSSLFRTGQPVKVSVMALPGRVFEGKVSRLATAVDPNIHRLLVRSDIADPDHLLRPGMFASFVIETGEPVQALAAPMDAIVRQGDGTMTIWVTADRHHFTRKIVKIGLQEDGYDQILDGVEPGALIVTKGAVFLSNMLDGGGES